MKTAVVGLGRQGMKHLSALAEIKDIDLVGVCDTNPDIKSPYPLFTDYQDVIKTKPDAVVVSVPNGYHKEIASFFLQRNIHVIKEKPLALSYSDGLDLIKLSKKNKKTLFTCQQRYYSPLFKEAKKQIPNLGALKKFFYSFTLEDNKNTWYWDKKLGGGSWINMGWHGINMLQWMLGNIDRVDAVHSIGGKRVWKYETDHSSFARVQIAGAMGSVFFSCVHPKQEYFRAEFENGSLYLTRNSLRVLKGSKMISKTFDFSEESIYTQLHKNWISAVKNNDYDYDLDLATLKVIDEGIYASN